MLSTSVNLGFARQVVQQAVIFYVKIWKRDFFGFS